MCSAANFNIGLKATAGKGIPDLTSLVTGEVRRAGLMTGLLTLFIAGSTTALTTIEYDNRPRQGHIQGLLLGIKPATA